MGRIVRKRIIWVNIAGLTFRQTFHEQFAKSLGTTGIHMPLVAEVLLLNS